EEEIRDEPEHHADARSAEAEMPTDAGMAGDLLVADLRSVDLGQRAAYEVRQERTEVDADVEDRVRAVATCVVLRIEPANLRRDVGLEAAVAENEAEQREEEHPLARHQEVAHRHEHAADDHRLSLAENAVGEHAAEERRHVHEPGVKAVDLRRELLRRHR